ncbi:MAG: lipopolysaccharide kinase InaA family protein, partial [Azonexus sp.]|nr:lipopolysaccharide kinase InaA family protein [Azonexus sp.]
MLKLDAKALAAAGRNIPVPFDLALPDGRVLTVEHLLRVLPGKRVVGRARLEARVVLVKFFVAARSEQHWQRELAGLRALDAAGLPTPGLLEAMPLKEGGHVLLTRFLPDAESLASLWQSDADDAQRVQRLFPVMSLLAQMHATGLAQADLHLGNFLVTQGRYYVIDGDAVTHAESKGGLSVDARLDNLAILFAQLPPSWDGQISPVLQHYSAAADGMQFDAAALQERIIAVRQRRLKEFLGKLGRDCTQFAVDRDFSRFSVVDRNTLDSLREV